MLPVTYIYILYTLVSRSIERNWNIKLQRDAGDCVTFMRSDGTDKPSGHMLTVTSFVQHSLFLECGPVSFVNSCICFFVSAQNKTNQIVPEVTVDLRGATIGWASKDKSSKKNVLEVRLFVDMKHNAMCAVWWMLLS